jgi:ATP:cob(I)alamin adenosyltransferase
MLTTLESTLADLEGHIAMPREFVVPGETRLSAALEVARATLRRAERRIVSATRGSVDVGEWLLPYVNRLADLLWVLARAAEQAESSPAPPSREGGRRRDARAGSAAALPDAVAGAPDSPAGSTARSR